ARQGVGEAAKTVAGPGGALVRLELELASLELKRKVVALGVGIALAAGAVLFLLYMVGFLFATIAAGFATTVSTWLALLITAGILLLFAAILGALAVGRFQKGTPPVPGQATREARLTAEALKSDGTGAYQPHDRRRPPRCRSRARQAGERDRVAARECRGGDERDRAIAREPPGGCRRCARA